MSNTENPKSPYPPNDPRNPRNPTDQKNPGDPSDPKNPTSPFEQSGSVNPQESGTFFDPSKDNFRPDLSTNTGQTSSSPLQPTRSNNDAIQSSDIVAILQNKGKVTLNGRTLTLKEPSALDPRFQEMIKEPTLSVTPVGKPSENGSGEYELTSTGRKLTIKIDSQSN